MISQESIYFSKTLLWTIEDFPKTIAEAAKCKVGNTSRRSSKIATFLIENKQTEW